jgi:hypothetical protein
MSLTFPETGNEVHAWERIVRESATIRDWHRMTRPVLAGCAVAMMLGPFAWGQLPIGPEFQVNTYTTGDQSGPQVSSDAAGNFVVSWVSYPQDGSSSGAFARRFAAGATPLDSSEFVVPVVTLGGQGPPAVSATPDGAFDLRVEYPGR